MTETTAPSRRPPVGVYALEFAKQYVALLVAGSVFLLAPLGTLVLDGADRESLVALTGLLTGAVAVVFLGHLTVAVALRRVSWPWSTAAQVGVWSTWSGVTGFVGGSVVNLGEVIWGVLVVSLPVTLIALALRVTIPRWRPDARLRETSPVG